MSTRRSSPGPHAGPRLLEEHQYTHPGVRPQPRAVASIGQGGTCDNYLMHIFQHDREHLMFHQTEWSEGNAWKAWLWIIQETVAHHNRECGKAEQESLDEDPLGEIAEALAHHVENQLPWSDRPWGELVLRSRHWINHRYSQVI